MADLKSVYTADRWRGNHLSCNREYLVRSSPPTPYMHIHAASLPVCFDVSILGLADRFFLRFKLSPVKAYSNHSAPKPSEAPREGGSVGKTPKKSA